MYMMVANTINTLVTCVRNAMRAVFNQLFFSVKSVLKDALKKDMVAMSAATKANITKNCPSCPGNKCSPSNFIIAKWYGQMEY